MPGTPPVVLLNLLSYRRFSLSVYFLNLGIEKIEDPFLKGLIDTCDQPPGKIFDILTIDMVRISMPVQSPKLNNFVCSVCDTVCNDLPVELYDAEHVHEIRSPGVIASESYVAVEIPGSIIIFHDTVME